MKKNTLETLIRQALKEAKRPDYPDVDGDGDTEESMEKALKDKKLKEGNQLPTDTSDGGGGTSGGGFPSGGGTGHPIGGGGSKTSKSRRKKANEAEMSVGDDNTSFKIKVDVSNKQSETKLGIRIQLEPKDGMLEPDVKDKVEIAVTKKLNNALEQFDMQVSKDTDVPDPTVLGFFIPLSQIKNMIVKSIKGGPAQTTGGATPPPAASPKPPTPPTGAKPPTPPTGAKTPTPPTKPANDKKTTNEMIEDMISEAIISEMRVRDLKEISKVVIKEDFYAFINAGQNVLRTMEGKGMDNGKKYLEYLVKHNIM